MLRCVSKSVCVTESVTESVRECQRVSESVCLRERATARVRESCTVPMHTSFKHLTLVRPRPMSQSKFQDASKRSTMDNASRGRRFLRLLHCWTPAEARATVRYSLGVTWFQAVSSSELLRITERVSDRPPTSGNGNCEGCNGMKSAQPNPKPRPSLGNHIGVWVCNNARAPRIRVVPGCPCGKQCVLGVL